jgi:uncharacterized membrane protein YcaP (DUF421 family)
VDLVIRAAVAFAFILFVTRATGTRELSQLEPFDLIMLVVIGDLVQQGVTQSDYSVTGALIVLSTIAALTWLVSWLNLHVRPLRTLLEGEPVILIEHGRLIERNLRRERLTPGEVAAEARMQQIANLADVEWAVLETSGRISFIPRKPGP